MTYDPSSHQNPFASNMTGPGGPQIPGGQQSDDVLLSRLQLPAIFMIIIACMGIILLVLDTIGRIYGLTSGNMDPWGLAPPNADTASLQTGQIVGNVVGLIFDVIVFPIQGLVIYGSLSMMKARRYKLVMAACITCVIPCISGCCVMNIPFGIWSLVLLNDPQIKGLFARNDA